MLAHTQNLVQLEEGTNGLTGEHCSGLLAERSGRLFLLTAGHALRTGRWFMETTVTVESDHEVLTIPVQPVNFLRQFNLTKGRQLFDVDFAWAELDLKKIEAQVKADQKLKGKSLGLNYYKGPLNEAPVHGEAYGFAAWNRTVFNRDLGTLRRKASYEVGMEYSGTVDYKGLSLYKFKLERDYVGHHYYKGASGAPIADPTGKVVSLVVVGDSDEGVILGLPLSTYASVVGLQAS